VVRTAVMMMKSMKIQMIVIKEEGERRGLGVRNVV
jgi:hypothetical protein